MSPGLWAVARALVRNTRLVDPLGWTPRDDRQPPTVDVVLALVGYAAAFAALVLSVWVVFGHPPLGVVVATGVTAVTAACLIAVVAFRTGRRDGRGPARSFGRAVWEAVKLLFSLP
jgi:VIT1/CCC1 family predicted Fe2+/Mn2+ transporter